MGRVRFEVAMFAPPPDWKLFQVMDIVPLKRVPSARY
jgi:hypothetical protein